MEFASQVVVGALRCGPPDTVPMWFYLLAAGLLLHTYFWGAGLALLAVPRAWRRWWWVFAPGFGVALQSAVVWAGAHSSLAGTRAYAWPSELLPLALLAIAVWTQRRTWQKFFVSWRSFLAVAVISLVAGWMLLSPMATASRGLTSLSLGSCDHADYAAGARVLQEFSHADRTGFMGLPEVTRVRSADYFFDVWLRMNHFTPAALVAHHGVVLDARPAEMISVLAVVLALLDLPLMMFMARRLLGLRGIPLLILTAIYAFSPLQTYAVQAGALGQLLAAHGLAFLTLAALAAADLRRPWIFAPIVLAAVWILAGSYNFILAVGFAPAAAGLLALAWHRRDWRGPARVGVMLAAMVAVCAAMFWGRFDGLIERFSLFQQHDFGWPVPLLSPEGWVGLVSEPTLRGWPSLVRVVLGCVALVGWLGGVVWLWRRNPKTALTALALTLPVLGGWGILAWESNTRPNASYDAYKLLSVFQPGLLAGLFCGLVAAQRSSRTANVLASTCAGLVLFWNVALAAESRGQFAHAPLQVTPQLRDLSQLENNPRVESLNMRIDDFWARLWANALLLKKPQYFLTHSYEGRLNTPLRGTWDLRDTPLRTLPFAAEDFIIVNARFDAVRVGAPGRMVAEFAASDWQREETDRNQRWRWADERARIWITNPSDQTVVATLRLKVRAITPRTLRIMRVDAVLHEEKLNSTVQELVLASIELPPGISPVDLVSLEPTASSSVINDERSLSVALYNFELRALRYR